MRLTLDTPEAVRRALIQVSWLRRPAVSTIEVSIAGLAPAEQDRCAEEIRRLYHHDGWLAAAVALVTTAVALAVLGADADWAWWATGAATLLCLAAAGAGRLLALAASGRRLRILLRHLVALGTAAGLVDPAVPTAAGAAHAGD